MYEAEVPTIGVGLLPPALLLLFFLALMAVFALRERSGEIFHSPDRGSSILLGRFLRRFWYWLLRPVENVLLHSGVAPALLNYLGFLASALSGLLFAMGRYQSAGFALLAAGCLDMLDGQVARRSGRSSPRGAFLDSSLDRYSEVLVFVGLMIHYHEVFAVWLAAALALGGSLMVSYCRARAEALGASVKVGIMQRAERLFLLISASVLTPASLAVEQALGIRPGTHLLAGVLILLAVGTNWTALTRFRQALGVLTPPEPAVPCSSQKSPRKSVPPVLDPLQVQGEAFRTKTAEF